MRFLSSFPVGAKVKILCLPKDPFLQRRLWGMGLAPGMPAEIFRLTGDNVIIDVSGVRLALCRALADEIQAAPEENGC